MGILIPIAIWILIGFFLARWEYRRKGSDRGDVIEMIVGTLLLGGMLTTAAIAMLSMFLSCWNTYEFKTREIHPIVSLRTTGEVHGSFFLGCGTIGTTEYYYFMYDLGGGRFMRDTAPACNVVIQETTSESPSFSQEVWRESIHPKVARWWPNALIPQDSQKRNWTLTVPPGTVIQRFEVK